MMPMPAYSVAIYSAEKCTLLTASDATKWLHAQSLDDHVAIDSSQLIAIQQALASEGALNTSRMLILVPDHWLSVFQCSLDHSVPESLRPLAALSYAVEATFLPPETLVFSYQYEESSEQRQLTVFACAAEWADQLCSPFQSMAKSCVLMSYSQWMNVSSGIRSWSYCSQWALSRYQPDKLKQQRARRLWAVLCGVSVLLHCVAGLYLFYLQDVSERAILARQQTLAAQSFWSSRPQIGGMTESALALVQALPDTVRLERFNGETGRVSFQMTLLAQDLEALVGRWRQQYPDWRWEVAQQQSDVSLMKSQKDVVDVFISVLEK